MQQAIKEIFIKFNHDGVLPIFWLQYTGSIIITLKRHLMSTENIISVDSSFNEHKILIREPVKRNAPPTSYFLPKNMRGNEYLHI